MKYVSLGFFIVLATLAGYLVINGNSSREICYSAGILAGASGVLVGQSLAKALES